MPSFRDLGEFGRVIKASLAGQNPDDPEFGPDDPGKQHDPSSFILQGAGRITPQPGPRNNSFISTRRNPKVNGKPVSEQTGMLIRLSIHRKAIMAAQFGSEEAWIKAGRPPIVFEGQLVLDKGFGQPKTVVAIPKGFVKSTPGNPNPNKTSSKPVISEDRSDTGVVNAVDPAVDRHKEEVRQFYIDNPDRAPPGFDPSQGVANRDSSFFENLRDIRSQGFRDAAAKNRAINKSRQARTTTFDMAQPSDQNRAAVQGQEGASTVNRTNDFTLELDNEQAQQRSQRAGYSGNRRFQPATGA